MKKITSKIEIKGLSKEELKEFLVSIGEQKFRGEQIYNWIYDQLIFDFNKMINLPLAIRHKLDEMCDLNSLKFETYEESEVYSLYFNSSWLSA